MDLGETVGNFLFSATFPNNLSIIGLIAEEVEAEVVVGGVEEDLRNL